MTGTGYEIANPDAAGTVASLTSLGYTVEAAVADLVDNSIAAGARRVDVIFTWAGRESWVAVVDDGSGMTKPELVDAMTVAAGASRTRTRTDLGRFGMGLKTASFSQARCLTVSSSAANSSWAVRTWDLDTVVSSGEWRLLHEADPATLGVLDRLRALHGRGTIVVWRGLRRYDGARTQDSSTTQRQFYAEAERVTAHLGMVFGRYMPSRLRLTVADEVVPAWDPFLSRHPSVQRLPVEEIPVNGRSVRVEAFVLPHPGRLSPEEYEAAGGPLGWLDQQGFYVYRRDRLIVAGDWLGLRGLRRDEGHNLARIVVDVPAELDAEWRVDVRKSSVVPPVAVRTPLLRIGAAARQAASEVIRHRGRLAARTHGVEFAHAWRVEHRDGRIRCLVNRQHPLVREALRPGTDTYGDIRALVRLLEETVPVAALRILHQTDTVDDPEPFAAAAPAEVTEVAERIYAAQISQGRTPREARERIGLMPPFDGLHGFWNDHDGRNI